MFRLIPECFFYTENLWLLLEKVIKRVESGSKHASYRIQQQGERKDAAETSQTALGKCNRSGLITVSCLDKRVRRV